MHSAGDGLCFDQGELACMLMLYSTQRTEHGLTLSAILMHHLLYPDRRFCNLAFPKDGSVKIQGLPVWPAMNNRMVSFMNATLLHRDAEKPRRRLMLCHQHGAACFPIQSIDDGNLAAIRQFKSQQILQPMPKRRCAIWCAGVDLQRRRFIHDDVVVRLVDDGKSCIDRAKHISAIAPGSSAANWRVALPTTAVLYSPCSSHVRTPSRHAMYFYGGC